MIVLRILGGLLVVMGGIGLFLPVWPTTIFWILAAICFSRSSPAARDWLYARPGVGPQIEAFIERGSLSRPGKLAAITGIVIAGLISASLLLAHPLWLVITIAALATVILFVASVETH